MNKETTFNELCTNNKEMNNKQSCVKHSSIMSFFQLPVTRGHMDHDTQFLKTHHIMYSCYTISLPNPHPEKNITIWITKLVQESNIQMKQVLIGGGGGG